MWAAIIAFVVSLVVMALQPRPVPSANNVQSADLDDLQLPNVDSARFHARIYGRMKVKSLSLARYFGLRTVPIVRVENYSGGWFHSDKKVTSVVGHKYYLSQHLMIGYGPLVLKKIGFGDFVAWSGTQSVQGSIHINEPTLFGPEDEEGGVVGWVRFYPGSESQTINNDLQNIEPLTPAFKGVAYILLDNFYTGNSQYFPPVWVEVEYFPDPYSDGVDVNINNSANPIFMILDMNCNQRYGVSRDLSYFDETLMRAAAADLANEEFGLSLKFVGLLSLPDFENEIFRHINAMWREDFNNVKKYVHLVRGEFDIDTLPALTEDDIEKIESYRGAALTEVTTTVEVVYVDRASDYKEKSVRVQNTGTRLNVGRERVTRFEFKGIDRNSTAVMVADREAGGMSRASRVIKLKTANRKPAEWLLGQTIKVVDAQRLPGQTIVMDIIEKNEGKLTDSGMRLSLAENRFAFKQAVFTENGETDEIILINDPSPIVQQYILEAPRWFVDSDDNLHQLFCFAAPPTDDASRCHLEYDITGAYVTGALSQPLQVPLLVKTAVDLYEVTTLVVTGTNDFLSAATVAEIKTGMNILFIETDAGGEFIGFESVSDDGTDTTFTSIKRGLFDTVPQVLETDARVWLLAFVESVSEAFSNGQLVKIKHRTITARGVLSQASATEYTHTVAKRGLLPIPPGNVTVNGLAEPADLEGDTLIAWVHRDRSLVDMKFQTDTGEATVATDVTYTLKLYDQDDVLLRTQTGLTGLNYTYARDDEMADTGDGYPVDYLRFELFGVHTDGNSYQSHDQRIHRKYFYDDDFNRSDESPLSDGGKWVGFSGSYALDLVSTEVKAEAGVGGGGNAAYHDSLGRIGASQFAQVTISALGLAYDGLLLRAATRAGYLVAWAADGSVSILAIGGWFFVTTDPGVISATGGDVVRAEVVGAGVDTIITVFVNGLEVLSETPPEGLSDFNAGDCGMWLGLGGDDTGRFDNFSCGDI
jgi:hypothetical protein